jgi:hypothetical protein
LLAEMAVTQRLLENRTVEVPTVDVDAPADTDVNSN